MRLRFRFNTAPFSRFAAAMAQGLSPQSGPMREGLLAASDIYMESQRRRYGSASHGDGTWRALAESTVEQRESEGETPPMPILHKTGELEASLQRGDENHVLEVTDSGVTEGTRHPLAIYHQRGTSRMPAREILTTPTVETLSDMKPLLVEAVQAVVAAARQPR